MKPRRPSRIVFSIGAIFAAFVFLVIAFVSASLFVLNVSSKAANELRLAADKRVVDHLMDREVLDVAQKLAEVAWWDATVRATETDLDMEFFTDAMLSWFPKELGIDMSALVSTDVSLRLHADGHQFLSDGRAESFLSKTRDLVERAQQNYFNLRLGADGQFRIAGNPVDEDQPLFVSDFRKINGAFGILVAQAIVPDDELTLPDGAPQVLVGFRKFTPERLKKYAVDVEVKGLDVSVEPPADMDHALAYSFSQGSTPVYISWHARPPSDGIWRNSMPALLAMLLTVSLVMLSITIAYARLVHRTREAEARNRFLAEHDSMTGLANRALFDRRLQAEISGDRMDKCAVLCIDLDQFKPINDTYGHQAGDEVLRVVAQRLVNTIGEHGLVARLGGDEFIVLLFSALEKDQIMQLCDDVIEQVCQKIIFNDRELYVGASVGVAWWPDDGETADMVIRSADQALYRAKDLGRGRAVSAEEVQASVAANEAVT